MTYLLIKPEFDKPSVSYRQKLAWKINEEDWNRQGDLVLDLEAKIPGTCKGGLIALLKIPGAPATRSISFITVWPNDTETDKIHVEAAFSMKAQGDEASIIIEGGCGVKNMIFEATVPKHPNGHIIKNHRKVTVNPTQLFDDSRFFIFEAELLVETNDPNKEDYFKKPNTFVKDMKTIFHDDQNSDVVIVVDDKTFKCHKAILSARCEVFKNMLAPHTLESETNTINVREVPAEVVDEMLKHIYTGEIPNDPEILSIDLLRAADMYKLLSLKAACVENLLASLDVSSCISTFVMMDRFLPHDKKVREKLTMFMKCKAEEVIESEEWERLAVSHASLVTELTRAMLRRGCKENHKCQFCVVSYGHV